MKPCRGFRSIAGILSVAIITLSGAARGAEQGAWRWRSDDADEYYSTWRAEENVCVNGVTSSEDDRLRLRLSVKGGSSSLRIDGAVPNVTASSAAVVGGDGFVYFAGGSGPTTPTPLRVTKVRISDWTVDSTIPLGASGVVSQAFVDQGRTAVFFVIKSDPSTIVAVRLYDFTVVLRLVLARDESYVASAAVDIERNLAYLGTFTGDANYGAKIVKIDLSSFSRVGSLTLRPGENQLTAAAIDTSGPVHYAYFIGWSNGGGYLTPVKINLDSFTRVAGFQSANSSSAFAVSAGFANGYVYYVTGSRAFFRLSTTDFSQRGITMRPSFLGESFAESAKAMVVDAANGRAYVSLRGTALDVVRLGDFFEENFLSFGSYTDYAGALAMDPDLGYIYAGPATGGAGRRISYKNRHSLRLEYGRKTTSCDAVTTWTPIATGAGDWQLVDSRAFRDGERSHDIAGLSNPPGVFSPGFLQDTTNTYGYTALGPADFTETEYSMKASISAAQGAYCFRLTDGGVPLSTYSSYPEASIAARDAGAM